MKNFIIYHKNTGEILRTGSCPESMISIQASELGELVMEGQANDSTQKINISTEKIVDKTIIPCSINKTAMLANGIDSIIMSNLPNPSAIKIKGEEVWQVTDGTFEFTIDTPGKYEIIASSSIYLSVEYTINAS